MRRDLYSVIKIVRTFDRETSHGGRTVASLSTSLISIDCAKMQIEVFDIIS